MGREIRGGVPPGKRHWLKRQAVQVVAMLPEDTEDALRVLAYARSLVRNFMGSDPPEEGGQVMPFDPRPPA